MSGRLSRWLGRGLTVLGLALLATWVGLTLESRAFQASLGRRLESLRRHHAGAHPGRDEALAAGLIGRIEIPRLGLSAIVIDGTDARTLRHGVGHTVGTPYPGEPGNAVLAGHRDSYFRDLRDVVTGDRIRITTPDGEYAYQVDSILVVDPDRDDLLGDLGHPALTLVTCYPFYWVGPAPRRFIVRARRADRAS